MEKTLFKVIGCGDAFSNGGRLNTCFLVKTMLGNNFLIDCGAGALAGLKRFGIKTNEIDTILITHFHGDHYGGLPFFLLEAATYERREPLTIISPPGCKVRISRLLELLYPGSKVLEKLDLRFLTYSEDKVLYTGYLAILALPVVHSPASLPHGLRIGVDEKVISYSGDTEWTPALETLARDVNLFICECNFYDTEVSGHINYLTLMANRHRLECEQILLTHLDKEMLENLENVSLPCLTEGMEIAI